VAQPQFWVSLGLFMYSEAAALLLLSDSPLRPQAAGLDLAGGRLHRITFGAKTCGASRRAVAAASTTPTSRTTLTCAACRRAISNAEGSRLSTGPGIGDFRASSPSGPRDKARGVVPLDIKLGNFIRGASSGRRTGDWRNKRRATGGSSR